MTIKLIYFWAYPQAKITLNEIMKMAFFIVEKHWKNASAQLCKLKCPNNQPLEMSFLINDFYFWCSIQNCSVIFTNVLF